MSLKWTLRQWNNPTDKDAPKKFYACPVWDDEVDKQKLAEKTAKPISQMPSEVTAVLDSVFDLIPDLLMDGDIINLGRLGKLKLTFSSDGKDKAEDVSASDIKNVRIIFRPSVEFKQKIAGVSITKYEPKVSASEKEKNTEAA